MTDTTRGNGGSSDWTLIIGNKAYSSWSLRPWFLLSALELPFTELRIPLYTPGSAARVRAVSPSGKVPALRDGEVTIWDSLAICEYVAERVPDRGAWPSEPTARAVARSVSAEMHSGFAALREPMPMNTRARGRRVAMSDAVRADVERIQSMWRSCRQGFGSTGPWLFGRFSIADAMYAPVVFRFVTYGVERDAVVEEYIDTTLAHPAIRRWITDADAEAEVIAQNEVGR